jgi:oxygen-independent coproporphyrinogen-3 oxidase
LGVQDFDPEVQRAVNRIQSVDATLQALAAAREHGFKSVSVDLIYGLPKQTLDSFAHTLDETIKAKPDRIAVYGYAHMPRLFKAQRQIDENELPSSATRIELMGLTIERLTSAGYLYIGMDHFALPSDELAQALTSGHLHRNFQGYSTRADCDLIALGVSSIGKIGDTYSQNAKTLHEYYAALDADELPIQRGLQLNHDDLIRRAAIQALMCQSLLDKKSFEMAHSIRFDAYFSSELEQLSELATDGLIQLSDDAIRVTPSGRLLIRNIAMVFDAYLPATAASAFSKAI